MCYKRDSDPRTLGLKTQKCRLQFQLSGSEDCIILGDVEAQQNFNIHLGVSSLGGVRPAL